MRHQMELGPCLAFFTLPLQEIFQGRRVVCARFFVMGHGSDEMML
jgi:hypothetical protein